MKFTDIKIKGIFPLWAYILVTFSYIGVYILDENLEIKSYADLSYWSGILAGAIICSWLIYKKRKI